MKIIPWGWHMWTKFWGLAHGLNKNTCHKMGTPSAVLVVYEKNQWVADMFPSQRSWIRCWRNSHFFGDFRRLYAHDDYDAMLNNHMPPACGTMFLLLFRNIMWDQCTTLPLPHILHPTATWQYCILYWIWHTACWHFHLLRLGPEYIQSPSAFSWIEN